MRLPSGETANGTDMLVLTVISMHVPKGPLPVGFFVEKSPENAKPWDYCGDTKEEILASSVTVQVVDAKGQILRTDMKGRRGIKELSEIIVVGTVASADGKAIVVSATSIVAAP